MNATATWGWRLLVAVSVLLLLNGVALYAFIVDTQTERTLGVLLVAFAALALAVALQGLRHRTRWAWNTSRIVVVSLAAIAAHTFRGGRLDVPLTCLFLGAIALGGLLLARTEPRT